MQLDLDNLPSDTILLHRLVRDMASVVEQRDGEIGRLQLIIKQLHRSQFGRRSERLDADQLALGLEDVETDKACAEATEKPAAKPKDRKPRRKPSYDRDRAPELACRRQTSDPTQRHLRGRTKTGRLWVYARDQRPWGGTAAPAAVYVFAPDRKGERPASHLEHFSGVLHVDGYAGFERLQARGNVVLAACWAHTRRYFYEFFEANGSPVAAEALRRIGELYAIEERIRGQSPAHRMAERRALSKPLVDDLKLWLEQQLAHAPGRGKLAEAIRYALSRWHGLMRFLHDGRIELDTNPVERAIRPVALGRKNYLFAGSDAGGARWATLCSLIETCKLNDVEPYAYLHDVLQRMVDGHPINRLDELLPWNWKSAKAVKI